MDNKKVSNVIEQYSEYVKDGSQNWDKKNEHLMEMLLDSCEDKPTEPEPIPKAGDTKYSYSTVFLKLLLNQGAEFSEVQLAVRSFLNEQSKLFGVYYFNSRKKDFLSLVVKYLHDEISREECIPSLIEHKAEIIVLALKVNSNYKRNIFGITYMEDHVYLGIRENIMNIFNLEVR